MKYSAALFSEEYNKMTSNVGGLEKATILDFFFFFHEGLRVTLLTIFWFTWPPNDSVA